MSRSWIYLFALAIAAPVPAIAQQAPPASESDRAIAEKMLGTGGRITRDTSRNACLRTVRQGEIVVCAPETDTYRVPSTSDDDPTGAGADDGRLRTPDVSGNGIFKGKPTMAGLCVIPPCPPEQPYIIDLSTIPEAPAGSDADRIAKGELRAR
ncbi:hypothetical protein SAMN06296065_10552 [Novosphingobium panipatense]|uniref:Uncharacterized protein n=2 Tax=Sphingomonadaceae TaxID=41297 RepID=A0ABY1QEP4_9SPHN|nr:hypothetical protein SAMN06296065_10552 [Novosphingobium panipatense]